ncbi:MAG: hypothetical protein HRT88_10715, partial [Lentisphaeraceae bacterium]|nr:hypothetical protein [Lentisphaeraceae bacterium]
MKKLVKIAIALVALLVVALVVVYFMLGGIIKTGVETVGPELTQGEVKLEEVNLSITGSGGMKGLDIGNPKNADFKSPFAFKVGSLNVKVQIGSITSDKIIVDEILIDGAELCWDGMTGKNHQKILENIDAFIGGGEEPKE